MLKGQLSRVSWSGNSWMPFTFQPGLQALQQPHKDSHSLQLPIHTHWTSIHSACFMNSFPFFFFFFQEDIFNVPQSHIKTPKWHLKGPLATSKHWKWHLNGMLATSKWHTVLVYNYIIIPLATMGKSKQINISKSQSMISSFPGRRRNGLATSGSSSSNCIWMWHHGIAICIPKV